MEIISHRGAWVEKSEQNSLASFKRALDAGFGIETDIRDQGSELVIAHDPFAINPPTLGNFLELASSYPAPGTLALNVKSCGLGEAISRQMSQTSKELDYFVFDAAVPDLKDLISRPIPVFIRMSELETELSFLEDCQGIWVDELCTPWISPSTLQSLVRTGKRLCFVSPELHGRKQSPLWELLRPIAQNPLVSICTDIPFEADEYFNGSH